MRRSPTAFTVLLAALHLVAAASGAGCRDEDDAPAPPANQTQPLRSPSGVYVLTVPIERGPGADAPPVWTVTIADADGAAVYRDAASEFVAHLNVYWAWDRDDRPWLYNSDDGAVWYWERRDGGWTKTRWTPGAASLAPPDGLFPAYVRTRGASPP